MCQPGNVNTRAHPDQESLQEQIHTVTVADGVVATTVEVDLSYQSVSQVAPICERAGKRQYSQELLESFDADRLQAEQLDETRSGLDSDQGTDAPVDQRIVATDIIGRDGAGGAANSQSGKE